MMSFMLLTYVSACKRADMRELFAESFHTGHGWESFQEQFIRLQHICPRPVLNDPLIQFKDFHLLQCFQVFAVSSFRFFNIMLLKVKKALKLKRSLLNL